MSKKINTKLKARLTQGLSLAMLGGVASPYAVLASNKQEDSAEEYVISKEAEVKIVSKEKEEELENEETKKDETEIEKEKEEKEELEEEELEEEEEELEEEEEEELEEEEEEEEELEEEEEKDKEEEEKDKEEEEKEEDVVKIKFGDIEDIVLDPDKIDKDFIETEDIKREQSLPIILTIGEKELELDVLSEKDREKIKEEFGLDIDVKSLLINPEIGSDQEVVQLPMNKAGKYKLQYFISIRRDDKEVLKEQKDINIIVEESEEAEVELRVEDTIVVDLGEPIKNPREYILEAKIDDEDVRDFVDIDGSDVNINKEGVYYYTFTLKDKNGKTMEKDGVPVKAKTKVVVENNINFQVPEEIILEKSDKKFEVPFDGVIAEKGEEDMISKLQINHNVDLSNPGEYSIDYTLVHGAYEKTLTTKVRVVEGPEFIVPEEIIVKKGDKFVPSADDIVANIEGKDMADKVKFDHNVDTNKVGEYELKYTLEHDGKTYERASRVLVVDGIDLEVQEKAVIEYGSEFNPMDYVEKAKIGDIDALDRVEVEHEVDTEVPGEYDVVYSLDLGNGKTFEKTMKLTVLEEGQKAEDVNTKPDGENYEDPEDDEYEYEYEYEDDGEEVVNEVVQTGEAQAGFDALRTALMSTPIIGLTFGSYKDRRKRKK